MLVQRQRQLFQRFNILAASRTNHRLRKGLVVVRSRDHDPSAGRIVAHAMSNPNKQSTVLVASKILVRERIPLLQPWTPLLDLMLLLDVRYSFIYLWVALFWPKLLSFDARVCS